MAFSIDIPQWLEQIEWNIVYLAKLGNLPPEWVEKQDIARTNTLVNVVSKFIQLQYSRPEDDTGKEWL